MGMNRGRSTGGEGGWEEGREQGGGAGEWGEGEGGRKRAKGEEVGREHPTPSTHQSSRNRRRRLHRKGGRGAEGGEGGGAGGGGGAVRRTRRDRGGRERGDEGKRGDREGSMKVGGRQKWGGGGGGEGTTCRGEQTMLVGKRDGRGGQVRDENGDPVVERVGSLGTTSRQWDMLIRTLFHDTNERPIRVCIGVCPAPTAMSPPSPQPGAGEEPRGGAASEGGAQEGPTTALAPAPIHTDTGSNSTNRRLEQEGIGMDRAGTTVKGLAEFVRSLKGVSA